MFKIFKIKKLNKKARKVALCLLALVCVAIPLIFFGISSINASAAADISITYDYGSITYTTATAGGTLPSTHTTGNTKYVIGGTAGTGVYTKTGSGSNAFIISGGNVLLEIKNDGFVFNGQIKVNNGASLVIAYSPSYTSSGGTKPTMTRNSSFTSALIHANGAATVYIYGGSYSNGVYTKNANKLTISGNGGHTFVDEPDDPTKESHTVTTTGVAAAYDILHVEPGTGNKAIVNVDNVILKDNNATNHGGGAYFNGDVDVTMVDTEITNCYTSGTRNGGGIYAVGTSVSLKLKNTKVSNNYAYQGGGIYATSGAYIQMIGGEVSGNVSNSEGGGMRINHDNIDHLKVELDGTVIKDNISTGYGGGIYILKLSAVLNNVKIDNNKARRTYKGSTDGARGGGLVVWNSKCEMSGANSSISDNEAYCPYSTGGAHGGAVYVTGSDPGSEFTMNAGTISNNKAGSETHYSVATDAEGNETITPKKINTEGGAIYVAKKCTFIMNGGTISDNTVYGYGGAIRVYSDDSNKDNTTFEMHNGTISGNTVLGGDNGGGVYIGVATMTMDGGTISGNTTTGSGGGIYASSGSTILNISGGTIQGNNAANGGGIFLNTTPVTITGVTITENEATQNGGGIYANNCACTISGATISSNEATGNGGGLYVNKNTFTLSGSTKIQSNVAANGGGIFLHSNAVLDTTNAGSATISANYATTYGGGIYANSVDLTISAGTIDGNGKDAGGNVKTARGGGIFITGSKTLTLSGSAKIQSNVAANGGGIFLDNTATLDATNAGSVTISANYATTDGGGIYANSVDLTISAGTIDGNGKDAGGNVKTARGGGIFITGGKTLTLSGSAKIQNNGATNGGGIFLHNTATLDTTNAGSVTISANYATADGGGIYANSVDLTISAGTISGNGKDAGGNVKTARGGGIFITGGKTLTLSGSAKIQNNAATNGGGVYLDVCKIYMNSASATVSGNKATQNGAGIFSDGYSGYTILSGTIDGNIAGGNGGGIYSTTSSDNDKRLTLGGDNGSVLIQNNQATNGGGLYLNLSSVTLYKGDITIQNNTASNAGGGIYANATKEYINFNVGTISGNQAKYGAGLAAWNTKVQIDGTTFDGNIASINGGGIFYNTNITTVTFEINAGSNFNENEAANYGGAVYVNQTTLVMTGGTVSANSAIQGAGIFLNNADFNLSGGTITGNTASDYGGGVRLETHTLTMSGTAEITNNIAESGSGGGVYINDGHVVMSAGEVSGNKAAGYGGGFQINGDSTDISKTSFNLSGTALIQNNQAGYTKTGQARGGGISMFHGKFTMAGGTITQNKTLGISSETNHGGGIYVSGASSSFTMDGGAITNNYAGYENDTFTPANDGVTSADFDVAGGVYCSGTITINGGTFTGNTANGWAGAIYAESGNTISVTGNKGAVVISNNISKYHGGAIFSRGTCTISAGIFKGNTASYDGGAIYAYGGYVLTINGANVLIAGNSARNGGGIAAYGDTFTMTAGTVGDDDPNEATYTGNTATGRGGGVYLQECNASTISGTAVISYNQATGNESGGGGVCAYKTPLTFSGSEGETKGEIKGNSATGNGGGVYALGSAFTLTSGTITGNSSKSGGGVHAYTSGSTASFTMNGGVITANSTTSSGGGGVSLYRANGYMTAGSIIENTTTGNGAAVRMDTCDFTIVVAVGKSVKIDGNRTTARAGAFYIEAGNFSMTGTTENLSISNNKSTLHAGAFYIQGTAGQEDGRFEMNGGLISGNRGEALTSGSAGAKGGFLYINKGSVIMRDGEISNNWAGREGGCAYVSESDFVMEKGVIEGNYTDPTKGIGGGAFYVWYGSVTIGNGCYVRNNSARTAGGAFYVSFGDFTMNGGELTGNSGTEGGAVYLRGGTFEMNAGLIEGNYATNEGGAVDVAASSVDTSVPAPGYTQTDAIKYFVSDVTVGTFIMTGGTIRNNGKDKNDVVRTVNGGAVCVSGGNFEMRGGTIESNFSTTNGGALYIKLQSGVRTVRKQTYVKDGDTWKADQETTHVSQTYYGDFVLEYDANKAIPCLISDNVCGSNGGAIYVDRGAAVITGGETTAIISGNRAGSDGGAIYINGGVVNIGGEQVKKGSVTMNGGKIINNGLNEAKTAAATNHGGAVYVANGDFTLNAGLITGNKAVTSGGAVYVNAGDFTMNGTTVETSIISGNTAGSSGGAVYVNAGDFTMNGGTLDGNKTTTLYSESLKVGSGGAVYVKLGDFTMEDGRIINSESGYQGGAVYITGSGGEASFTMNGGLIDNNRANANGGAVYAYYATFKMTDGTISNNTSRRSDGATIQERGGAVVAHFSTFTMDGGTITGNEANDEGGAVYVADGNFIMSNGIISANRAPNSHGGAVYLTGGSFTIYGGTVTRNTAKLNGGAVYVTGSGAAFTMTSNPDKDATVYDISISYNYAESDGGAVYLNSGNFTMDRGSLSYNGTTFTVNGQTVSATSTIKTQNGGAVYVNSGNFTMTGGTLEFNRAAVDGGAVYVNGGTFTLSGSNSKTISSNYANNNGGAVYVAGSFTMSNGTITGNGKTGSTVKTNNGGAVYVNGGSFTMSAGAISENAARNDGGAVYVSNGSFSLSGSGSISENLAMHWGGAVVVSGTLIEDANKNVTGVATEATFEMTGGSITGNRAHGYSGAVHVYGGTFTMSAGSISNNIAKVENGTNRAARGGAVGVWYGTFTLSGTGVISGNYAESPEADFSGVGAFGGAVYVTGSTDCRSTFNMDGGTISDNYTQRGGGAVYVANGNFNMTSGTISGNYTTLAKTFDNQDTGFGGAVYVSGGNFTMSNGTISGNGKQNATVKTRYGGAVYVSGGTFSLSGGTLDGNEAAADGGAVYVNLGDFTMSNGTLKENRAGADGGAVYVLGNSSGTRGRFTLTGGTITCNFAASSGGAVYVESGLFEMSKASNSVDSILSHNYSNISGGAVYLEGGNFEMEGGTIEYNGRSYSKNGNTVTPGDAVTVRGGAVYVYHGNFTMSNGTIRGNKSTTHGGAVYVFGSEAAAASNDSTGVFTMEGGSITDNHTANNGGAVYVQYGAFYMSGSSSLSSNTAGGNGGAVVIYYGTFTMENGTISENTAANGGAVYVHEGNFIMSGSSPVITLNSASVNGGAVYVKGNGTVGRFEMSAGTLSGNTATGDGGAVFVNDGNFDLSGANSQIIYNNAEDQGGAVYVASGDFTMSAGTLQYNGRAFEVNGETISVVSGAAITEQGGAVYVNLGNFIMSGGTIADSAANNAGGAVFVLGNNVQANREDQLGVFSMTGGSLLRNKARNYGGAVYVDRGLFEMSGNSTVVSNNHTTGSANGVGLGGAVFVNLGNFIMSGGTLSENGREFSKSGNITTAGDAITKNGGAVYVNGNGTVGSFNFSGGTISANGATSAGGAVLVKLGDFVMSGNNATTLITGNFSNGQGGAVYVDGNGTYGKFEMNGGTISANTSAGNGGAVYLYKGDFKMTAGIISGNSSTGGHAGAVFVNTGDFEINNTANGSKLCKLENNRASSNGGAVYVHLGKFTVRGTDSTVIISDNSANASGGAVYVYGDGTVGSFDMYGGKITQNSGIGEIVDGVGGSSGGAVSVNNGNFTMHDGEISYNSATREGGAVSMSGGKFTMKNGVINNNTVDALGYSGGALYMWRGEFVMEGGVIHSNSAPKNGGAVSMADGTFTMSGGTIRNNTAGANGGAVQIYKSSSGAGGQFIMTGGVISDNSGRNGGAVLVSGGSFTMSAGTLSGNTAAVDGGAVYVSDGNFTMTSGSITNNTAGANGGGFCVVGSGLTTIGVEGCYGDANLPATNERPAHTSCPVIAENNAANGGAMALIGSSPVFHCGQLVSNTATSNGGGVYVSNASITMNYAEIEKNEAVVGGGIYVESSTANANVTVDSGKIISNTAEYGGGIAVRVTVNGRMATIIIGRQGCDGDVNSTHKHPDISGNIATLEGGGLSLISMDANKNVFDGISFVMYCGVLSDNVANQNVPTGNVLQEGGSLSISGKYEIDNATVINGTYLRPGLGNKTVNIIYHYEENGVGKTTTVTVAVPENGNLMKINLPSALPKEITIDGKTKKMILVRWELNKDAATSYQCGVPYTLNETTVGSATELHFYAVWIYQGAGYAEAPIVSPDEVYNHVSSGLGATIVEIGNYFTVQFEVSECDPSKFNERYLSFNELLMEGTTIIMVDITTSGTKAFYYYTFDGTETQVSLSEFRKLGTLNTYWANTISNPNNNSEEEFLFIFDFSRTEVLYSGTLQVTLTRTYFFEQGEEIAPITQVGSCSVVKRTMPEISIPANDYLVDDKFDITYTPGFIAERTESIFYSDNVALIFTAVSGTIPTESYMIDEDNNRYYVNRSGYIIVPLGAAKETHTKKLQLIAPYLIGSGAGIELKAAVNSTPNAASPIGSYQVDFVNLVLNPKPIPSVDISVDANDLIHYIGELPASVSVAFSTQNIDGYDLVWTVLRANGTKYEDTEFISVSDSGVLTFSESITEGVYRIVLTVEEDGNEIVKDVQNIAVITRVAE